MPGAATDSADDFTQSIRPVLAENCGACHNPAQAANPANFLKAQTAKDIEADRGLWHNVAAQLRNRTMPPVESKLTEEDRLRVATWIDNRAAPDRVQSAAITPGRTVFRRLNRREYHNTVRDLLGIDFDVVAGFPGRWNGRRRLRHQRRNALHSAGADGALSWRRRSRFWIA